MHGTAVLSRYPIARQRSSSAVCYDWFLGEKKEISKLEAGKRGGANLAFMERITREVRRGGRTTLIVELAVPESPTGAVTVVAPHLETKCKPEAGETDGGNSRLDPRRKKSRDSCRRLQHLRLRHISYFRIQGDHGALERSDKWATSAIKWSTGAPTILLMPVNMMRNKNDPTGFDVPLVSRKKEAKLFGDLKDYRFEDGNVTSAERCHTVRWRLRTHYVCRPWWPLMNHHSYPAGRLDNIRRSP